MFLPDWRGAFGPCPLLTNSRKTGPPSRVLELLADLKADPFALLTNSRKTGPPSRVLELLADPFALLSIVDKLNRASVVC